jgi:hypothetical protein
MISKYPCPFFMKLVIRKGGDVMDANAMGLIILNVHP